LEEKSRGRSPDAQDTPEELAPTYLEALLEVQASARPVLRRFAKQA